MTHHVDIIKDAVVTRYGLTNGLVVSQEMLGSSSMVDGVYMSGVRMPDQIAQEFDLGHRSMEAQACGRGDIMNNILDRMRRIRRIVGDTKY